jgi:SAM-dependent methyltransferase
MFSPTLNSFPPHTHRFAGLNGLEIGGASSFFSDKGLFPVYPLAARIDNCNFGHETTWEGQISEGSTFQFNANKAPGYQYVMEARDLGRLASDHYDFLISSHMLEHTANPLLALSEWIRVVKPGGTMVLVLPHKDGTFDHRRPATPLSHIIQDFEQQVGEDDLTHLEEILALHDLHRDPEAGDHAAFAARSRQNAINRCLHHHVFITQSAVDLIRHTGLKILAVEATKPFHIFILAEKPHEAGHTESTNGNTALRWESPFPSDQMR